MLTLLAMLPFTALAQSAEDNTETAIEEMEAHQRTHGRFSYLSSWACERCHDRFMVTPTYEHPAEGAQTCEDCHDLDLFETDDFFLTRSDSGCPTCHAAELTSAQSLHTATAQGFCTGCHDPHGSDRRGFLKGRDDGDLCLSCHADLSARGDRVHEPITGGMCTTCHGAHGAKQAGNLHYALPGPCTTCHTKLAAQEARNHGAVTEFGCTGCHDPHWARADHLLEEPVRGTICHRCHEDDITGRVIVHAPVGEKECLLCHDPHGTPLPSNLVSMPSSLCIGCHPEKGEPKATPHPALEIGCTAVCHDPHASDNRSRLRAPIVELCTTCHVYYDDGTHVVRAVNGLGHPIGLKPHPHKEGRLVECSSCHNPHGSDNPRMWYFATERLELCAECHPELPYRPNPRFNEWLEEYKLEQAVDLEAVEALDAQSTPGAAAGVPLNQAPPQDPEQ